MLFVQDDHYGAEVMVGIGPGNEHLHAPSSLASLVWSNLTIHALLMDQRWGRASVKDALFLSFGLSLVYL